jgi:ribosomal protein L31E
MKIKINHNYGQTKKETICQDLRFNKRIWAEGSDPRVNRLRRHRRRACSVKQVAFAIKRLGALSFCLFLIAFLCWDYAPKEVKEIKEQIETKVEEKIEQVKAAEVSEKPPLTIWERHFGDQARTMKATCTAESQLDPNAIHKNKDGSWDYGTCQINTVHSAKWQGQNIFDPEVNLAVAKIILDDSGLNAWTCYKNGSYLKYLDK